MGSRRLPGLDLPNCSALGYSFPLQWIIERPKNKMNNGLAPTILMIIEIKREVFP